jgi:hypothetical protein
MANQSLTAAPLSHNDIQRLAAVLENNFQAHRKYNTRLRYEYLHRLKAVVGLGFTAVMVDGIYISIHRPDFDLFLDYFRADSEPDSITFVSLAAAKIMDTAAHVFRKRDLCKNHYKAFVNSLEDVVKECLLDDSEKAEDSDLLLQMLIRKDY